MCVCVCGDTVQEQTHLQVLSLPVLSHVAVGCSVKVKAVRRERISALNTDWNLKPFLLSYSNTDVHSGIDVM